MNLEPGAYMVCGFVSYAVEVRQRELGSFVQQNTDAGERFTLPA